MISILFELPRKQKRIVSVCADAMFIPFAFWLAMSLRLDKFYWPPEDNTVWVVFLTVLASIFVFVRLGLYRAVIRYMSNHALIAVVTGVTLSALALVIFGFMFRAFIPRSVPFIYWCIALLFVGGSRMLVRSMFQHQVRKAKERVIIYGAGSAGLQLSSVLYQGDDFQPVAFIDDNPKRQGNILNGLRVYPPQYVSKAIDKYGATRVFLALGSAPKSVRALVLRFLEDLPVKVQTIPEMSDIVTGKATIAEIRDVDIDDLLGRDTVVPEESLLTANIKDKVVMVTGAGGSIGSELCRQIIAHRPKHLVLFELSEFGLYRIEQELQLLNDVKGWNVQLSAIMGSVQKQHRLEVIMKSFAVDTVYHAAAYKHVPMVEHNVVEGVRNNVFGTWYAAEAAINAGVDTFVLISTDKAVRPTNIMGASKRMAELVLQGLAKRQNDTRFCMVRFGNVLGSSGSVVPLFRAQIEKGGPVTVTDPDVIRYFMTIPEAAQLVLQAGAMGKGGEVFVLNMGEPVKIDDLARKMIHLMGLEVKDDDNPEGDIEITYTGLRPGEKLYEELLIGDNPIETKHPRITMAEEKSLSWTGMAELLEHLDRACHIFDCETVRNVLLSAPTDFKPSNGIDDLVWRQSVVFDDDTNIEVLKHHKKDGLASN